MMRPSGVLTRFMVSTRYQVSDKYTTQKEALCVSYLALVTQMCVAVGLLKRVEAAVACGPASQTLLPLHLSFCRTTLKNEASGNDASGSVFLAFRIVTVDPRSTWIGLRPSSVRKTG